MNKQYNICVNYYGQPRNIDNCTNIFNNFIFDYNCKFTILYTTWNTENIEQFKDKFENAYIRCIDKPEEKKFKDLINKYKVDQTNSHKTLYHCLLGLYIKYESGNTIKEYIKNTYNFDIIITLRTDTKLSKNPYFNFYNNIIDNSVYIPNEPKYDVYKNGACPDTSFMSNQNVMLKILNQVNDFQHCILKNTIYHPESSFYNYLIYLKLNLIYLPIYSFPCSSWTKINKEYVRIY